MLWDHKAPLIKVSICGRNFLALLDTGASISLINQEVISLVNELNIKKEKCFTNISWVSGNSVTSEYVNVTTTWVSGKRRQKFHLVPELQYSVLLGRDFICASQFVIDIFSGGWYQGSEKQKLVPFDVLGEKRESGDAKRSRSVLQSMALHDSSVGSSETGGGAPPPASDFIFGKGLHTDGSATVGKRSDVEPLCNALAPRSQGQMKLMEELKQFEEVHLNFEDSSVELYPSRNETETSTSPLDLDEVLSKTGLTDEQTLGVKKVMEEFAPLFSTSPGVASNFEYEIDTGNSKPIKCNPRLMTPAKRKILEGLFKELLSKNAIEESNSPWASNTVIVPKPNGKFRLCVDFRPLNKVTVPDSYTMSRIDDILTCLGSAKYISTFDVTDGFYNIPLSQKDKCKTAFNTPWGLYHFLKMCFGLRNSPATFQKCMDRVLGKFKWIFVTAFMDDLIIFSNTLEEHIKHLRIVFTRLLEEGLRLHPGKFQLLRSKIVYLGYIIENGTVSPSPDKLSALEGYQRPKCVKDIQRFLGLCGYYRQFIPDFSIIAKPLTSMMKKGAPFFWSVDAEKSFEILRCELLKSCNLHLPDLNNPFIIQTDSSDIGIGAVLLQEQDKVRYPVWFYSRVLNDAERNYSVSEKECLAVIQSIKKFKGFIEYSHFTVETDHQALCWLMKIKEPTGRLARWALELQGYNFDVAYRAGNLNRPADALSRAAAVYVVESLHISREELVSAQDGDFMLKSIKDFLLLSILPNVAVEQKDKILKLARDAFVSSDGCLYKRVNPISKPWEDDINDYKVWVPDSLKLKILEYFHCCLLAGHLAIRKTYFRIEERFWWKSMRKDVVKFVSSCLTCQKVKPDRTGSSFLGKAGEICGPWERISIDLMGPYTRGINQSKFLLVVVDSFSKWVELSCIRKSDAKTICTKLWECFCRWGVPKSILSDNGTQFQSKIFEDFCKTVGSKSMRISPYHAQANPTERYNQTLKSMIVSTISQCKDWDRNLAELSFAIRSTVNESTGFSPAYLNFGRELRTPLDNNLSIALSKCVVGEDFARRIALIHSLAKSNMVLNQANYMGWYNKARADSSFDVGDQVLLKCHHLSDASKGFTAALAPKYDGPFEIIEKIGLSTFVLKNNDNGEMRGKFNSSLLKKFIADESFEDTVRGSPRRQDVPVSTAYVPGAAEQTRFSASPEIGPGSESLEGSRVSKFRTTTTAATAENKDFRGALGRVEPGGRDIGAKKDPIMDRTGKIPGSISSATSAATPTTTSPPPRNEKDDDSSSPISHPSRSTEPQLPAWYCRTLGSRHPAKAT